MCNTHVKERMRSSGVRQWQIAEYLGISEATMYRKMRVELDAAFRDTILGAIDVLSDRNSTDNCTIKAHRYAHDPVIEK